MSKKTKDENAQEAQGPSVEDRLAALEHEVGVMKNTPQPAVSGGSPGADLSAVMTRLEALEVQIRKIKDL